MDWAICPGFARFSNPSNQQLSPNFFASSRRSLTSMGQAEALNVNNNLYTKTTAQRPGRESILGPCTPVSAIPWRRGAAALSRPLLSRSLFQIASCSRKQQLATCCASAD